MANIVSMDSAIYTKFLAAISPSHLELRLFATEKCNFRCVYCYEDFELGRMEPWVRNGIKNLIEKRCANGLKTLYISWFGGEPLLALDVIEEIQQFQIEMLKKYPDLVPAPSGITTNGYLLTPEVLTKLVGWGVTDYQITLDGSPAHHNKTRLRADGEGTYDQIFKNLIAASKTQLDFRIDIRMHLHSENGADVEDVLTNELIQYFAGDPRFNLHPISIGNYGGAFDKNNIKTTTREFANGARARILDRFKLARNKGQVSMQENAPLHANAPIPSNNPEGGADVCYAAAANSFAIRSDGNLVKCTTALTDARNQIGKITESGELDIDSALVKLWMTGFVSGNKGELACPLHKVSTLPHPSGVKIIPIVATQA